jgi:hypothetical protein
MHVERSIRSMTPQEKQAKREWGTGACQVRGCTAGGLFGAGKFAGEPDGADWWQYCCPKHARQFADQHGLDLPTAAPRAKVGQDSAADVHAVLS